MTSHFYIDVHVIESLWIAWMIYWFISAFNTKRAVYRPPWNQRFAFLVIPIVLVILARHGTPIWKWGFPPTLFTEITGCSMCIAGLVFSVWARVHLGHAIGAGLVTLKENHELVMTGPYRLARHPIYTGILLAAYGSILGLSPSWGGVGVVVGLTLVFILKLRQEEKLMVQHFPEQYPAYKGQVRAAASIPFVV